MQKVNRQAYRIIAMAMLFSGSLLLSGCGPHTIVSNPQTFQPNYTPLPVIEGHRAVGFANAYPSEELVDVTVRGPNWIGDLQAYTNSALTLLKTELQKANIDVSGNPAKEMTLRVYDVDLVMGAWLISCTLKLDIQLSDGRTLTFAGENKSPNGYRALDGAILRTVEGALEDKDFLDFLDIVGEADSDRL